MKFRYFKWLLNKLIEISKENINAIIFLGSFFLIVLFIALRNSYRLRNYGKDIYGEVYEYSIGTGRMGNFYRYFFIVNNQKYYGSSSASVCKTCYVGQKVKIRYYIEDPSLNGKYPSLDYPSLDSKY